MRRPHSGGRNKPEGPVEPPECKKCGRYIEPWEGECPCAQRTGVTRMSEEQINKLGETAVELAEENHTLRSLNETLLSRLRSAEVALQDRADHFEENQRLLLRLHTLRDAVRPLMAYPGLMEYVGTEIFQKAMQALHEATPTAKPSPVETQDD